MWKGFLKESQSYMNYPKCGRLYFWLNYPLAWIKFMLETYKNRRHKL